MCRYNLHASNQILQIKRWCSLGIILHPYIYFEKGEFVEKIEKKALSGVKISHESEKFRVHLPRTKQLPHNYSVISYREETSVLF